MFNVEIVLLLELDLVLYLDLGLDLELDNKYIDGELNWFQVLTTFDGNTILCVCVLWCCCTQGSPDRLTS